jgi:hypothetical protein
MQNSVKTPNKTPRPIKSFRIASDAENFVAYVISRTPDFDFTTWINELIRKESKCDPMFNPTKNYRK